MLFVLLRLEEPAGELLVRLDVLGAGLDDDIVGKLRRGRIAVPPGGQEPVADKLLVERLLSAAGGVFVGGPEAGTVGGEHLVDEDDRTVRVLAELEFGIGDDDSAGRRVAASPLEQVDRPVTEGLGGGPAD